MALDGLNPPLYDADACQLGVNEGIRCSFEVGGLRGYGYVEASFCGEDKYSKQEAVNCRNV
jgi:hypothetical protein